MNSYFFALSLVFVLYNSVLGRKERIEDGVSYLSDKIWHELQKRLNDINKHSTSAEDSNECHTTNLNNTIIMAHASLDNGAEYIPSPSVNSAYECVKACCENEKCNVAVYKFKVSHYNFLIHF